MTGKRKREVVAVSRAPQHHASGDGHSGESDVFRRYFERVFEPLPESKVEVDDLSESSEDQPSQGEEGDEWEGFSDQQSSAAPVVQVIEHNTESASDANSRSKTEFKTFMVSRSRAAIAGTFLGPVNIA